MAHYRIWVVFHRQGMQWPLREGDALELRDEQLNVVARLPTATTEAVLAHHLDELAVLALFHESLPDPWRKPLSEARRPVDEPAKRAELRAQRRRRKR